MARRLVSPPLHTAPDTPPLPFLQKAFQQIALAKTATSALEAKEMGFLTEDDRIVMNADHLISAAKRETLDLADGYTPPEPTNNVYAASRSARAALEMGIKTMQWGHYASDYDGVIAAHVARVLTGGNLSLPQWVPEEYLLKLEKQSFLELLQNEKTHERIEALLSAGTPKRN
jgi:3-hydroxyacyl-CoA dehydrogenase